MIPHKMRKKLLNIIITTLLAGCGTMSMGLKPKPSLGAERVGFSLPVLGEFHLSVDSLEVFAKEGKITPEFAFYANRLEPQVLSQLRQALQQKFDVDAITVYRMTNMPMGEDLLKSMGEAIYTHPERNGIYAIRAALILAAADPEGLTAINVMRHFPTEEIQLDTQLIISLIQETANFLQYKDTSVEAVSQVAKSESPSVQELDVEQMPDLRQAGSYSVTQKAIAFKIDRIRQTTRGFSEFYNLDADLYLPEGQTKPAPLAIITHGLGSSRSHFQYLAEHLASHGYVVVVPEHIGSNSEYKKAFLQGELSVDVSPLEFYSRPLDVTYLLDEIENHSAFQVPIDWEKVGVLGHSFGGYTALALAGAPLNQKRINQVCQQNQPTLNTSMLLQCRASSLPSGNYKLADSRIKVSLAFNPVTSSVLGPESLKQITIPTMILGGSQDIVAPFIEEQVHPFLWLETEHKYLGVMVGAGHGSISDTEEGSDFPDILKGSLNSKIARDYLKAISLAFLEVHLRDRSDYQPYLSSTYTQTISPAETPLYLVESLTPEQLKQAYGNTPPTPPIPEAVVATAPRKNSRVLTKIENTQTLKIAMRSDAAPFGYIDEQQDVWTGYCEDFANLLGEHLAKKLNISSGIEVIKLSSNLENRFELVQQNTVDLECGPNSIRRNQEGVRFSSPFFVSGTRFLVNNQNAAKIDPESSLTAVKTGVLQDTKTSEFVQKTYSEAEIVDFQGSKARMEGVRAVANGNLDAFISDGVLLIGEIERQNLGSENYQLIPKDPLTCDFYGLILPQSDSQWRATVNTFIRSQQVEQLQDKWLGEYFSQSVSDTDYCLNERTN
ncbi:alpha/beta fold hydrolase [Pleurocapsa sp. PCC 7319]|uniref:alpha/beta fold hydrolase n=1 Tax=Pleurocapsa sp. PCC 7319 TaxID=118161 RepID=UPI00034AAEF7|nr:alpha/beta fold hydrolase [Pleurocapsa sp. PCC 7319]